MTQPTDLRDQAFAYHRRLPPRLWKYLNERGIPDALIHRHLLGWDGHRITIPITNRDGKIAFFKLAKDPEEQSGSPKMLATPGASVELYGWQRVLARPSEIVICEGEFDRLVLESHGLAAVTSTAGAGVFRADWAKALKEIPEVYICFDRDEAGRLGARQAARMIPHARIVELPEEAGPGGDVTDFFVRLRRGPDEFRHLLESARPSPTEGETRDLTATGIHGLQAASANFDQLKQSLPIENVVGRYVLIRKSGQAYFGRCPFHEDRHPSLVVYPKTQSFHCYGCQVHGDVFGFLMRAEGLSFPEALKVLHKLTQ